MKRSSTTILALTALSVVSVVREGGLGGEREMDSMAEEGSGLQG